MKALIIKDLAILKNQVKTVAILAVVCLIVCFTNDAAFATGYMALILSLLVLGTLSYDEYDHGYSFLFTLPFARTTYVFEKYLVTLLSVVCGVLIALFGIIVSNIFSVNPDSISEALAGSVSIIFLAMSMASIMIPTRLKYGSENAKIVSGIVLGLCFAGAIIFQNRFLVLLSNLGGIGSNFKPAILFVLLALIALLIIGVSMVISIRIIKKKEF